MKKITLALLALILTAGLLWAYEGTWECDYDTAKIKHLKVTGSYDLLGSGGAGYADSLRDSTGTTHAADLYARKNAIETVTALRKFEDGIWLNAGADVSQYLWLGPDGYMAWYYNYPSDFWINKNLRVTGDTVEFKYVKATGSNLPGMTIYSSDSVYETTFWIEAGANMSLTLTDTSIKWAASGTTSATKADSLLDYSDNNYYPANKLLRLDRASNIITGNVTFSTDPVFMGDAIPDSVIPNTITIDSSAVSVKAYKLGDYTAIHYPRKNEIATVDSPWIFKQSVTIGDDLLADSLLVKGKGYFQNDVFLGAEGISPWKTSGGVGKGSALGDLTIEGDIAANMGIYVQGKTILGDNPNDTVTTDGFLNVAGGSNISVDSTAKAGWAGVADSSAVACTAWSVEWDSIDGMPACFADGIDNTGGAGGSDTALYVYNSVNGSTYAGSQLAVNFDYNTFTKLQSFPGGIDVNGNILADGGVYLRTDAEDFEVDCNKILLGDDASTDSVKVKAVVKIYGGLSVDPTEAVKGVNPGYAYVRESLEVGGNIVVDGTVDGIDIGTMLDGAETDPKDNVVSGGNGIVVTDQGGGDYLIATDPGFALEHSAGKVRVKTSSLVGTALSGGDGGPLNVALGETGSSACAGNDSRLGRVLTGDWYNSMSVSNGLYTINSGNPMLSRDYGDARHPQIDAFSTITRGWTFDSPYGLDKWSFDNQVDFTNGCNEFNIYNAYVNVMGPKFQSYSTTEFDVDGPATFDSTVIVNGTLTANGAVNIYTTGSAIEIVGKEIDVKDGQVTTTHIAIGTIINNDISALAEITKDKISSDGAWPDNEVGDDLTINSSGTVDARALTQMTWPIYSDFIQATATGDSVSANDAVSYTENGTSYLAKLRVAFYKQPAMDYLNVRFRGKRLSAVAGSGYLKMVCSSSVDSTAILSPTFTTTQLSLDIRSLTSGYFYETIVYLRNVNDAIGVVVSQIQIYGATSASL